MRFLFLTILVWCAAAQGQDEATASRVADTKFSVDRGFYQGPFYVQIHTATENARIVYTTNGMTPGSVFTSQSYPGGEGILIETTTVLRVMATTQGHVSTVVDTHTYIFPEHVVHQPEEPLGFSTAWQGADYGMDQDPAHLSLIAGDPNLSPEAAKEVIADALLALPTLYLAHGDLFGKAKGIHRNTQDLGKAWERPVFAEWIYPDGRKGFQIDGGIPMQRFTSRDPARNPKHSLRLVFRDE